MTLTEQWKKGELSEGYYYFKMPDGAIEIASEYRLIRYKLTNDADKIEVLAPVPSYEEWQRLQKYAHKCEVEYIECANDYEKLKEENQQLKELLKECREKLKYCVRETYELQTKIDNATGEKK